MNLTTKTAKRLRDFKENEKDGYDVKANIREIVSFKNELKEILDDKNPDEPILKYYERMYIRLMTLKEEIESVENDKNSMD